MGDSKYTRSLPAEEIAKQIEQCDILIYLCTGQDQPNRPNGQPWERNLAWTLGKQCAVLTLDEDFVPLMLKAYTYRVVREDSFQAQCSEFISSVLNAPALGEGARLLSEEEALDN